VAQAYAGILGPLAFLTCLARGLTHGGGTLSTLLTAWCCLLAFSVVGCVVGWLAERIVEDSVRSRIVAELAAEEDAAAAGAQVGSGAVA
jgi:hypothetical protein